MNDESPLPSRRRVLVRGVDPAWIIDKIRSYEELDRPGEDLYTLSIRGPHPSGWLQLDVDPRMPLYHFHNLGMWMVGMDTDQVLPETVILESTGPLAVDYWLVPRDKGSVLHGRRADGSAYAYDLAGGLVRTEPELQAPAVTLRLALLNRGVPLALMQDWDALPQVETTQVRPFSTQRPPSLIGRLFKAFGG